MRILRSDLSRLPESEGAVVVIDVLRSFSTAAYALAAGAKAVMAVESVDAAWALRSRISDAFTIGSVGGGAAVPDFDAGNSPSALARHDLRGRTVIQYTAGGVKALVKWQGAEIMLASSLVCARATARYLRRLAPQSVTLVVTGEWTDRDGDEDHACADYLQALLQEENPDPAPFAERVRNSDFGRRFSSGADSALPVADLDYCAAADRFDFAMAIRRAEGCLLILAVAA